MKIVTKVEFSQEEIYAMIKTLKCLNAFINEPNVTSDMSLTACNAFDELSKIVCLDPVGKQTFRHEKL